MTGRNALVEIDEAALDGAAAEVLDAVDDQLLAQLSDRAPGPGVCS